MTASEEPLSFFTLRDEEMGRRLAESAMERLRRLAEGSGSLQGVMLWHNASEGVGAGVGSVLLERLRDDLGGKKSMVTLSCLPRVEPFLGGSVRGASDDSTTRQRLANAALATRIVLEQADLCLAFQPDCDTVRSLARDSKLPARTCFAHAVAGVASDLTCAMRGDGAFLTRLPELVEQAVIFPGMNVATTWGSSCLSAAPRQRDLTELTLACFRPAAGLAAFSPVAGRYLSCALLYRGCSIAPKDVMHAVSTVKAQALMNFADWSTCGMRCAVLFRPMVVLPGSPFAPPPRQSVTLLANTTGIVEALRPLHSAAVAITQQSQQLLTSQLDDGCDVSDGFECDDLLEAVDAVETLIGDYAEVSGEHDGLAGEDD